MIRWLLSIVLLCFSCTLAHAQQDDVIVTVKEVPTWGSGTSSVVVTCPSSINNAGASGATIAKGGSTSFQARMVPGQTYQLINTFAANGPTGATISLITPLGYYAQIGNVARTSGSLAFSSSPNYTTLRVVPVTEDVGLRAGMATSLSSERVLWRLSLGSLLNGAFAGHISLNNLASTNTLADMFSSANLNCDAISSSVYITYTDTNKTRIRQVIAPEVGVDVAWTGPTLTLTCYPGGTATLGTNGYYTFSGSPYATYQVTCGANDAAGVTMIATYAGAPARPLSSTLTRTGTAPNYVWTATSWHFQANMMSQVRTATSSGDTTNLTDKDGNVASTIVRTLNTTSPDSMLSSQIASITVGSAQAINSTYSYTPSGTAGYGFPSSVQLNSGSVQSYTYFDATGLVQTATGPFKNTNGQIVTTYTYSGDAFGNSTRLASATTTTSGTQTAKTAITYSGLSTFTGHPNLNVYTATKNVSTGTSAVLSTVSKVFSEDAGAVKNSGQAATTPSDDFYLNQPAHTVNPDGTHQSYFYMRGSWDGTTFSPSSATSFDNTACSLIGVVNGAPAPDYRTSFTLGLITGGFTIDSTPVINYKSTLQITVRNANAKVVYVASYFLTGWNWSLLNSTAYLYNAANQLTQTTTNNGLTTTYGYVGELLQTTTDATGITTTYTYDSADRVQTVTTAGLQTAFTYDGASHILSQTVGTGSEKLVTQHTYDDAGRIYTESVPNLTGHVSYIYSPSVPSVTTSYPDGSTRIQTAYWNGLPKSVSGTSVIEQDYDYGVATDGTGNTFAVVSIGATNSPRWQKMWFDWIGRGIQATSPDPSVLSQTGTNGVDTAVSTSSSYNSLGQLASVAKNGTTGSVVYYQYDAFSQPNRVGLDVDGSGLSLTGTDRITDYSDDIESDGTNIWQYHTTKIYPSATAVTYSVIQKRLNLSVGMLEDVKYTDINGNTTERTVTVSGATTTITTTKQNLSNARVETIINGLLSSIKDFDGLTTNYSVDLLHRPSTVEDKRGNITTTSYQAGTTLVSSMLDQASYSTNFTYDLMGREFSRSDALSHVTYTGYTSTGQVLHRWGTGSYPEAYGYSTYGELTSLTTYRSTDPSSWSGSTWNTNPPISGDTTSWHYDPANGMLVSKQDAAGATTSFTYNRLGEVATATSARNITTHYTYDNVTAELLSKTYDNYADPRGTISTPSVSFTYTRLGQLDTTSDVSGKRSFAYTASNPLNLTTETLSPYFSARILSPSYETLTSKTTGTLKGRLNGFSLAGSSAELKITETISNLGRLTGLTSQTNALTAATFNYTYGTDGTYTGYNVGNLAVVQGYEVLRDLVTQVKSTWSGATVSQFDYVNNEIGQRQSIQQSGSAFAGYGGSVYRYNVYDARGELQTSAMYNGTAPALNGSVTPASELPGRRYEYRYDDIGNRTSAGETGNSSVDDQYTTNSINQYITKENNTIRLTGTVAGGSKVSAYSSDSQVVPIGVNGQSFGGDLVPKAVSGPATGTITIYGGTSVSGSTHVYSQTKSWSFGGGAQPLSYDNDGNLFADGINNYFYDAENRLVKVSTLPSAVSLGFPNQTVQFAYDYAGRRIEKRVTNSVGVTTSVRFIYEGWNLIEEIDGSSLGQLKTYSWNGGLAIIQDLVANKALLPTTDANGNIATLVNASSGAVEAAYEYGPSGELIRAGGAYANSNAIRFASEYQDDETGLIYYGYRYYSPGLGRFISRDPISENGGVNLYGFCGNDGVNHSDFLGMNTTVTETVSTGVLNLNTGQYTKDGSATFTVVLSDWDGTNGGALISWSYGNVKGSAIQYEKLFNVVQLNQGSFVIFIGGQVKPISLGLYTEPITTAGSSSGPPAEGGGSKQGTSYTGVLGQLQNAARITNGFNKGFFVDPVWDVIKSPYTFYQQGAGEVASISRIFKNPQGIIAGAKEEALREHDAQTRAMSQAWSTLTSPKKWTAEGVGQATNAGVSLVFGGYGAWEVWAARSAAVSAEAANAARAAASLESAAETAATGGGGAIRTIGLGLDEDLMNLRGTGAISYRNGAWQNAGLTSVDWGRAAVDNSWFRLSFREAAANADAIRFDVSSFDLSYPRPRMTNYEFNHVTSTPGLLEKTTFIKNGGKVFWDGTGFGP